MLAVSAVVMMKRVDSRASVLKGGVNTQHKNSVLYYAENSYLIHETHRWCHPSYPAAC